MSLEEGPFGKEMNHLPSINFQGDMLVFQGVCQFQAGSGTKSTESSYLQQAKWTNDDKWLVE